MEVTKVKYLSEVVTVERIQMNKGTPEKRILECSDTPTEDFLKALAAVQEDMTNRTGLKTQKFAKAFTVTGVSVMRDKHGHRQFSVSATLQFGYGPAIGIALPLLREKVEDEAGETVLSNVECKRIDVLLEAANAYANGTRVQGELDLGQAAEG